MSQIKLTFIGILTDFFPIREKKQPICYSFSQPNSIKDVIESLGVPHTEVDIIIVNGRSVYFSYRVSNGDVLCIYPFDTSPTIPEIIHLIPPLKSIPRFVLDTHLGKLASYLRLLGFDTLYHNDSSDQTLAEISNLEGRILLSRDVGLLKRKAVRHGYYIRSTIPREQLIEVINRYKLVNHISPFTRCIHCNGNLKHVRKSIVEDQLHEKTRQYYDEFKICDGCSKIYWKGSHYDHMQKFIGQIIHQIEVEEN
jgi:uncharacterized protein with PIN domain